MGRCFLHVSVDGVCLGEKTDIALRLALSCVPARLSCWCEFSADGREGWVCRPPDSGWGGGAVRGVDVCLCVRGGQRRGRWGLERGALQWARRERSCVERLCCQGKCGSQGSCRPSVPNIVKSPNPLAQHLLARGSPELTSRRLPRDTPVH